MKLKIARKNKDGTTAIVGKFAVIADEENETLEAVVADTCQIDELVYCRDRGVLQMQVRLGGHDSTGKFHAHPKYGPALASFHRERPQDKALWDEYGLDTIESLEWKMLKRMLHDKGGVAVMADNIWGIGAIESTIEE